MRAAEYWIRPYLPGREAGGLDAAFMLGLYDRMEEQGLARTVFSTGAVSTREDFLALCREPGAAACPIGRGDETLALVWLNGFEGRCANLHFCVFREGWPESVAIGRFTLDALLNPRVPGQTPPLDVLLGATPAGNRAARLYVRKVGFKVLGFIPHRFVNIHTGEAEAGMISFATRETLKEVL